MTSRRLAVTAAIAAGTLLVSGCSVIDSVRDHVNPPTTPFTPQSAPPGSTGLERYYAQRPAWTTCTGGQCADLTVPLDYSDPAGATITIAVFDAPATGPRRIGALVVNPGGPGASGVDYARAADAIVTSAVRARFDVVGFDPRGVARSEPIHCIDAAALDHFLASDQTPDTPAEEQQLAAGDKAFAAACKQNAGPLLGHVSTVDVAKDMDILRAALGESTLNYLGKSYGTLIGSTYAGLFPSSVGRFVLDGVVPPDLTSDEMNLGQAQGFERATRSWAQWCVARGSCPLGGTVDQVMQGLRDFLGRVDATPLTKTGDPSVPLLTEGWAATGIAEAMYSQQLWGTLVTALRSALVGDGSLLLRLADEYAERNPGGGYTGNIMQAIYAVNCLDRPEPTSLAAHQQEAAKDLAVAPTWGAFLAWGNLPCAYWPVAPVSTPHTISARGSAPIVVIGTTRDPATPYEWSVRLRDQLASASLISYDGDGHTAYMRSNACVNDAVDGYLIDATVPRDGLSC
jgi:pimeloyl-ACP methyl ester carboxylesterase